MPRPKRTQITYDPGKAKFILEGLANDGVVTSEALAPYERRYEDEVGSLMARLNALGIDPAKLVAGAAGAAGAIMAAAAPSVVKAVKERTASNISPAQAGVRALQGSYLGVIKQVKDAAKKEEFSTRYKAATGETDKRAVIADIRAYVAGGKAGGEGQQVTTAGGGDDAGAPAFPKTGSRKGAKAGSSKKRR